MIFHWFWIRKSFQNTSKNPPKIIKKIDQEINPFFNAFLLDFELQNGSKKPPESSQNEPVSVREREARYISVPSRKVGTTPASPENNNRFAHHGIPTTS